MDSKGATFVILKNHASASVRMERSTATRKKANRNQFVEKDGVPKRVESLGKVDRSKNRLRARLGFLKPIRNRLRKEPNLIENRPSRAKTDLAGREREWS